MGRIESLIFGEVSFTGSEEYLAFRFRFLCLVMLAGALLTGLLILATHSEVNNIAPAHLTSMRWFTGLSLGLWLILRGRKRGFLPVAWLYECLCMLEYISALYYVSDDEFRAVWFLVNIPGVFLLLGQRSGLAVTGLTVLGLSLGNASLPSPYSVNAIATLVSSTLYLGLFFYAYADRSISFFVRMRDANAQLYELAMHDPLTGVLNARAYYVQCEQLRQLSLRQGESCAMLFIDLDHFKRVNDTYGHAAGDTVLRAAAQALQGGLRRSDVLGRVGGEEFSVFLPDTRIGAALAVAEKIRAAIASLHIEIDDEHTLRMTASIGVAVADEAQTDIAALQQLADAAMYEAKANGRNQVACRA